MPAVLDHELTRDQNVRNAIGVLMRRLKRCAIDHSLGIEQRQVRDLARRDDTICDIESFAAVDGSYTRAADIYLGDTSSQVLEFLQRPRPVVFLDAQGCDWKDNPTLSMWHLGEVVTDPAQLVPALESAQAAQPSRSEGQAAFIARQMGAADGSGPDRAAHVVLEFLNLEGAANRSRP